MRALGHNTIDTLSKQEPHGIPLNPKPRVLASLRPGVSEDDEGFGISDPGGRRVQQLGVFCEDLGPETLNPLFQATEGSEQKKIICGVSTSGFKASGFCGFLGKKQLWAGARGGIFTQEGRQEAQEGCGRRWFRDSGVEGP